MAAVNYFLVMTCFVHEKNEMLILLNDLKMLIFIKIDLIHIKPMSCGYFRNLILSMY